MKFSNSSRLLAYVAIAPLALALGGCVVVPAHGYGHRPGPVVVAPAAQVGVEVMVAPPAPHVEVVGVAPGPGYFWIAGFWNWAGSRHVWVPGRWEAHRPGQVWVPHQWHQHGNGWRQEHGHWR